MVAFNRMVRRGLRGVWLRGHVPDGPFVWAANHHSWWDPFLAAAVLGAYGRRGSLVMRQDNVLRYGFVRRAGVFGTDAPRQGLRFLEQGRALVVFPEGELRSPGPLGRLARGSAWYARGAGVPLCAVATRVLVRGHEAPEAYLWCTTVDSSGPVSEVTEELARDLSLRLSDMDHEATVADARSPLPGYRRIIAGRRSWDERVDALSRWRSWPS
jgi:1-acyl-sn-glycerol-3-phosphate acyltransferase